MLILLDYQNSMKIIGFLADKIKTTKKKKFPTIFILQNFLHYHVKTTFTSS